MIFPGRTPLLENIPTQRIRLDDLLSEFSVQNFSGYTEFHFPQGKGILLFHSGEIVTSIYKEKETIKSQEEAIKTIKNLCRAEDGLISTYQIPSEMAHMLRGLCNRKLVEEIHVSGKLLSFLDQLKEAEHTGTLDLIFIKRKEKGMILLIKGRVSNTYLEMEKNLTLEGADALARIQELLDVMDGGCKIFQSDFSQEIWKSRRGTHKPNESRIYQLLTQQEAEKPRPLQGALTKFTEKIKSPFTAFLARDGKCLATISSEKNNGIEPDNFHGLIEEARSLFSSLLLGGVKEILCTSEDRNLLIRSLSQPEIFHVLILDRNHHPKDLRKELASLDQEIAALSPEEEEEEEKTASLHTEG